MSQDLTPRQYIKNMALVPLLTAIGRKRRTEGGSLRRGDESGLYNKAIDTIFEYMGSESLAEREESLRRLEVEAYIRGFRNGSS